MKLSIFGFNDLPVQMRKNLVQMRKTGFSDTDYIVNSFKSFSNLNLWPDRFVSFFRTVGT